MDNTTTKLTEWNNFSNEIQQHIIEKGKKYDTYNTMDIMSDEFCIDSIIKYAIEIKTEIENNEKSDIGSLFSIAHYSQELWRRANER